MGYGKRAVPATSKKKAKSLWRGGGGGHEAQRNALTYSAPEAGIGNQTSLEGKKKGGETCEKKKGRLLTERKKRKKQEGHWKAEKTFTFLFRKKPHTRLAEGRKLSPQEDENSPTKRPTWRMRWGG